MVAVIEEGFPHHRDRAHRHDDDDDDDGLVPRKSHVSDEDDRLTQYQSPVK